ncbi:MAG: hypothetical protein RI968_200 [Pseudomonadota bacterium]
MNELLAREGLPRYDLLKAEALGPEIDRLIEQTKDALEQVVRPEAPASWAAVMEPLGNATERLSHMGGVMDSPEWRELTNSRLESVTALWSLISQDERLYAKVKRLGSAADVRGNPAREQAIAHSLRDFRLGGAELPADQQKQFAEWSAALAQLSQRFSENLLDSTNASIVHVTNEPELDGLPQHAIAAAKAQAESRSLTGWVFTLQQPSLLPVLQFAKNRSLREAIYRKNASRASEIAEEGPSHDNTAVMGEILQLRQQQARLLGFSSAAERSLAECRARLSRPPDLCQDRARHRLTRGLGHCFCERATQTAPLPLLRGRGPRVLPTSECSQGTIRCRPTPLRCRYPIHAAPISQPRLAP